MSIEIANESGIDVDESLLAGLARHVLDDMRVHPLAELSVLLVDEPAMTELHVRWMGEEGPTDVLAFPMDELRLPQPGGPHGDHHTVAADATDVLLGDVVICPQVAAIQAGEADHDVQDEIDLLCTHGILHLLGYDHAEPEEHATMFGLQDRLLASWRAEHDLVPGDAAGGSGESSSRAGTAGGSGESSPRASTAGGSGDTGGSGGSSPRASTAEGSGGISPRSSPERPEGRR
jgi:probable rRNA maturation factor